MDFIYSSRQSAFQWSKNYGFIFQFHSKMVVSKSALLPCFIFNVFLNTVLLIINACGMKGVDDRELCLPSDMILACFVYHLSWQYVCIRSTLCLRLNIILSICLHLSSSLSQCVSIQSICMSSSCIHDSCMRVLISFHEISPPKFCTFCLSMSS